MHTLLVWGHVALMMAAFGASPLGRLGLRHLLSRASDLQAARAILRGFSAVFLAGGLLVTAGVAVGVALAWQGGLTRGWVAASMALIALAGIGGVLIDERWAGRLRRAEAGVFDAILQERAPLLSALASPVVWLAILWLMIAKPA